MLAPLNRPIVYVTLNRLSDYPATFRFMGRLLNDSKRGEALARYAEKTLAEMAALTAKIPEKDRITVYYAENDDGLSTECADSFHTELIPLCGGRNVHRCKSREGVGLDKVSMEQVMLYNPQTIVTHSVSFYSRVSADPRWKNVRAVATGRVFLIPRIPMNWFDRPPSFMRLLGARWLAHELYPAYYPLDRAAETRAFYTLFLNRSLTDGEIGEIFVP
jgi:iron complex transport system substrate-binding protein